MLGIQQYTIMIRGGAVYIMTNFRNGTLYTGVTSDLKSRVYEHKIRWYPGSFTSKYGCFLLVYYQGFNNIEEAIFEEKRIKGSSRQHKIQLIESMNPNWKDLWHEIN
jgi:putative endonuclease